MSKADDSRNHILRCLGIRPEEASDDDRKLAELLEERVGQWRWSPVYLEEARRICGIDSM